MTKHDPERGAFDEPRDERTPRERQQDHADEASRAESARVAGLQPGGKPASGAAPVEPHAEHFPHQPHGQAGQPQNRPAMRDIRASRRSSLRTRGWTTGISPTEAVTHGEPSEVVDTEYSRHKGHGEKSKADHDKGAEHKVVHVEDDKKRDESQR